MYVCIHIYIYICTQTHTSGRPGARLPPGHGVFRLRDGPRGQRNSSSNILVLVRIGVYIYIYIYD